MLWRVSAKRRRRPAAFIEPCLAITAAKVPAGDGWVHEIKHDGYRMQLRLDRGRVRLFTRRGFDWTDRYPLVRMAAAALKARTLVLDGELVCIGANGIADFARLHSRCYDGQAFLYAFDLLELDGEDWRPRPLNERKARLAQLLRKVPFGVHLVEHDAGDGATLYRAACRMGLEGIVSKKIDSRYRSGPRRCKAWVKVKNPNAPSMLRVRDELEG